MINSIVHDPEVGESFDGVVTRLMDFGAFVEFAPGKEGLVHISKMSWQRTEKVEDVVEVGQEVKVYVEEIDSQGRINLAMRDPDDKPEGYQDRSKSRDNRRPRGGGGRDYRRGGRSSSSSSGNRNHKSSNTRRNDYKGDNYRKDKQSTNLPDDANVHKF